MITDANKKEKNNEKKKKNLIIFNSYTTLNKSKKLKIKRHFLQIKTLTIM